MKVYNAYKAAVEHNGPADRDPGRTIKGYGLGEAGEGKNITHQQKKLNETELRVVPHALRHSDLRRGDRRRAVLPARRRQPELQYLRERRKALGGYVPTRTVPRRAAAGAARRAVRGVLQGHRGPQGVDDDGVRADAVEAAARQGDRQARSCRSFPTRRARSAWSRCSAQVGIYSHVGQLYEPVDMDTLLYYKEAKDGQILEEGITEAGSMSSFIAAGTAYATHGVNTIPFFIYYSMFGFQRVGDLIWAGADSRVPRLPARRHRRPDDAGRRRAAAPGRPQPRALAARCRTACPTIRRTPTSSR